MATAFTHELGVGETLPPLDFMVDAAFNEQFVFAVEDYHPRYLQTGAATPPVIHPALLFNMSSRTRSPGFRLPVDWSSIHARDEVFFVCPARIGDRLSVAWRIVDRYIRLERSYQVVEATVTAGGAAVLRRLEHSTVRLPSDGKHQGRRATKMAAAPAHAESNVNAQATIVGPARHLVAGRIIAFSGGAIGDHGFPRSNIHTDRELAARIGLSGLCASGGQCQAYLVALMIQIFGEGWLSSGTMAVRFSLPVPEGAVLVARARIVGDDFSADGRGRTRVDIWCEREDGSQPVVGNATGVL